MSKQNYLNKLVFIALISLLCFVAISSCSNRTEVILDANGGVFEDGYATYTINNFKEKKLLDITPHKEGYIFNGWYKDY